MILIAELISHFVNGNANMATIKKYQNGGKPKKLSKDSVPSEMFPGKMIPKSKSNYDNGNFTKMLEGMRKENNESTTPVKKSIKKQRSGGKTMLKRADGSTSQRGLWDNLRANKGSGKKPTAQMLKQERKIKSKSK